MFCTIYHYVSPDRISSPCNNSILENNIRNTNTNVSCNNCEACCCRLEVMLITETGVPDRFITTDKWGTMSMLRLADGWCAALDRNTLRCTIYEKRPLICRELEMGAEECLSIRAASLQ